MSNTFISDNNTNAANYNDHKEPQSQINTANSNLNDKIPLHSSGSSSNREESCENFNEKLNATESISFKNNNSSIIHDSRLNRDQNKVCCLHKTYNLILK